MKKIQARCGAALALLLALGCSNGAPEAAGPAGTAATPEAAPEIDTARAKQLVKEGAPVVDVRSEGEFSGGHLEGAKNIPVGEVSARLPEFEALVGGDKSKPIVVYCGSGKRAAAAKKTLTEAGFSNVVNGGGYDAMKE